GNAAGTAEVEALALVGAIDGEGVEAVVGAAGAGCTTRGRDDLRREFDEIDEVATERRHAAEQRVRDDTGHALARRAEVAGSGDADRECLQLDGLNGELDVHPCGGGQAHVDVVPAGLLEPETGDG